MKLAAKLGDGESLLVPETLERLGFSKLKRVQTENMNEETVGEFTPQGTPGKGDTGDGASGWCNHTYLSVLIYCFLFLRLFVSFMYTCFLYMFIWVSLIYHTVIITLLLLCSFRYVGVSAIIY